MKHPRLALVATVGMVAALLTPVSSPASAQDDDLISITGSPVSRIECQLPIAFAELLAETTPLPLMPPRNPLGASEIDPATQIVSPVEAAAVTVEGAYFLPPRRPSPDSGCFDFWDGAVIRSTGSPDYFSTSSQFTVIGVRYDAPIDDIDDQSYREYTFMWEIDGLPVVDSSASGLPDLLDGTAEGMGLSNNLGEVSSLLYRGNGVGADNFSNPLTLINKDVGDARWEIVVTPRSEPVTLAGTSAAEQTAESIVASVTAQPVVPAGPTTLDDIASDPAFTFPFLRPPVAPEPTTTPAPSTTTPETTSTPPETVPPAETDPPASADQPTETDPPVQIDAPAENATDSAEEAEPAVSDSTGPGDESSSDDDAGGGLSMLIVLAIAIGVVGTVLLVLLPWRKRSDDRAPDDRAPDDRSDGDRSDEAGDSEFVERPVDELLLALTRPPAVGHDDESGGDGPGGAIDPALTAIAMPGPAVDPCARLRRRVDSLSYVVREARKEAEAARDSLKTVTEQRPTPPADHRGSEGIGPWKELNEWREHRFVPAKNKLQRKTKAYLDAKQQLAEAEAALDRCVKRAERAAARAAAQPSPPPPPPPIAPDGHTKFRIRTLFGIEGGEIVGGTNLQVEIQDPDGGSSLYRFWGGGATVGLPVGVQGPSEWTDFVTTEPMRVHEFEGFGLVTAGGGAAGLGGSIGVMVFGSGEHPTQSAGGGTKGTGVNLGANVFFGWWELSD